MPGTNALLFRVVAATRAMPYRVVGSIRALVFHIIDVEGMLFRVVSGTRAMLFRVVYDAAAENVTLAYTASCAAAIASVPGIMDGATLTVEVRRFRDDVVVGNTYTLSQGILAVTFTTAQDGIYILSVVGSDSNGDIDLTAYLPVACRSASCLRKRNNAAAQALRLDGKSAKEAAAAWSDLFSLTEGAHRSSGIGNYDTADRLLMRAQEMSLSCGCNG